MSKSKLREEYEAMFGDVEGSLRLYDDKGNVTYYESTHGHGWWAKRKYDSNNNEIYYESSHGWWVKREYDTHSNEIYYESSYGLWTKCEYDDDGNKIYYENSKEGVVLDNRPCADKVFIAIKTLSAQGRLSKTTPSLEFS